MTGKPILKRHPLALAVFAALNLVPQAQAISSNLVISQVYGGGGNTGATYKNDFIELFNRGTAPVSLSGMSVQYASSTGTSWQVTNLSNVTLQPGQYYLVQEAVGVGGTTNLPTPDAVGTIAMSSTTGKVALVSNQTALAGACPTANVVDFLGFGAANCSEASPTAALSNTTADIRGTNGCKDTDSNSSDFSITAPAPRNAASALNACGNSLPAVNLSVSTNTASEAAQTAVTVTATSSSAVAADQTVNLAVSGTGISAGDYSLSSATITIPAGGTTGSITFTVVDDTLSEGTETATLTISNPSAGIILGSTITQNISITDNDTVLPPGVSLIQSGGSTDVTEGGATDSYTLALNSQPNADVTITTAADSQVTANPASVIFTSVNWNVPQTVTVTAVDDTIYEGPHTGTITHSVSSADNSYNAISVAPVIANITDNDPAPGAGCGNPATKISAVQGNGGSTPLTGVAGTVIEGIVVGDYQGDSTNSLRGYFVQEEDSDTDGNPATSEGIFVFDGNNGTPDVHVGDRVRVTGTPVEFFNMTQLGTLTNTQVCATNQAIPTPASLTLPVPNVPNGDITAATTAINNYYEAFEGMLVTIPSSLKVSEYFELERYGQLVLSQGGRIPTFTSVSNPGTSGLIDHNITLAKRQIILDDNNNVQNFYVSSYATTNNIPLPYPTGGLSLTNRFRGGDTITNLTGVLHWSFAGLTGTDAWRIRPIEEIYDYNFNPANTRKNVPDLGGSLKIAGFNVLNYFTTIDTTASNSSGPCGPDGIQDCRGADSAAELTRQTAKAAAALCAINADIFGLMELENNTSASLNSLITATNAISGCGPFATINTGIIGGDAIKVGVIYKPATVAPVGNYQLLTSSVDPRFVDDKNRPSLAQTFKQLANGEKLTIAINHLKSKGSDCVALGDPDANDGQGNCNLTRKNAAMALVDWLNSDPTGSGDPDYLIIGDLNSYAKEDPIKAIENGPDDVANTADDYTNLTKAFGGDAAYSYVFDGQTGYLDHAIANKSLLSQVTRAADWHINADEPVSFDYNDSIKDTGEASFEAKPAALPLYAADQYRTSDHDPVLIGLQLGQTINIINGTSARNTLTGTPGKDRITGLGSADTLTGGLNADEFVYVNTTDGIDTITDFTLGEDKIVLTALLRSLGYEGTNPLADGIIKFAASGNNTIVYIDNDGAGPDVQRAFITVRDVNMSLLNDPTNFIF